MKDLGRSPWREDLQGTEVTEVSGRQLNWFFHSGYTSKVRKEVGFTSFHENFRILPLMPLWYFEQ